MWPPGSADTVCPARVQRCNYPLFTPLYSWPWQLIACSIGVAILKFVGLPVRKTWHTSGLSISRPGDLDLWPLTLKLVRIIVREVATFLPFSVLIGRFVRNWCALLPFPPILVFLGRFVLDLSAKTCQTRYVTLRPWPLTFEVTALVDDAGLRGPSVYQVWSL